MSDCSIVNGVFGTVKIPNPLNAVNCCLGPVNFVECNAQGRITKFNLGVLNLTGQVPPAIGGLSELVSLELANNQFSGPIPQEFGNLKKLEILNAGDCQLSGLPSNLGDMTALKALYLDGNQITTIPPSINNLRNLVNLTLFKNPITGPLPRMSGLTQLQVCQLTPMPNACLANAETLPNACGSFASCPSNVVAPTVTVTAQPNAASGGVDLAPIIGGSVGGLLFLILVVVGLLYYRKRSTERKILKETYVIGNDIGPKRASVPPSSISHSSPSQYSQSAGSSRPSPAPYAQPVYNPAPYTQQQPMYNQTAVLHPHPQPGQLQSGQYSSGQFQAGQMQPGQFGRVGQPISSDGSFIPDPQDMIPLNQKRISTPPEMHGFYSRLSSLLAQEQVAYIQEQFMRNNINQQMLFRLSVNDLISIGITQIDMQRAIFSCKAQ
ncbi:hypothetical protein EDD86DRAFT_200530 [Gorgonomyces haynaldii]|nr:hypothetical protein EDD86DRAFT_200530 [Gorgonomyces haynaldii]